MRVTCNIKSKCTDDVFMESWREKMNRHTDHVDTFHNRIK